MNEIIEYSLRITPGISLIVVTFFVFPKKQVMARIFLLIMGFILMRDAMTPAGFWQFGISGTAIWLRFIDNGFILMVLGVLSLAMSLLLLRVREIGSRVRWGELKTGRPYLAGILTGLIVAAPFVLAGLSVPVEQRGGPVAIGLVPILLFFAMAGNFLEELIFRGFLQGHLERHTSGIRAAVLSGLLFGAAHIYLASTVTSLGWPLLVFVLVEGLACAFVYRRFGLVSAALVHGTVIFLLAAGLY